jgi:LmbE family N-acetylglucosaminyl deacetylase
VAHPDDEIASAVLLQRSRENRAVFATDGAPVADFFWMHHGSREHYAAVRRAEALRALGVIGIRDATFLEDALTRLLFQDQELLGSIPPPIKALEEVAHRFQKDALPAPAYEGGQPDHDTCSFLGSVVARNSPYRDGEIPFYHRSSRRTVPHRSFEFQRPASFCCIPLDGSCGR